MKFHLFTRFRIGRMRKEWYFRIVASNGEIMAQSEGYKNKGDALSTINAIKTAVHIASIVVEKPEK